jgi:arylformamidase
MFDKSENAPSVHGALLLGGLYDLAPLKKSFLQREIGLTDDEVSRFTPLFRRHDGYCRVTVAVGEEETPPFHEQAGAFIKHLAAQRLSVSSRIIAGRNHMNSVRDLGTPESQAGDLLISVIRASAYHQPY